MRNDATTEMPCMGCCGGAAFLKNKTPHVTFLARTSRPPHEPKAQISALGVKRFQPFFPKNITVSKYVCEQIISVCQACSRYSHFDGWEVRMPISWLLMNPWPHAWFGFQATTLTSKNRAWCLSGLTFTANTSSSDKTVEKPSADFFQANQTINSFMLGWVNVFGPSFSITNSYYYLRNL